MVLKLVVELSDHHGGLVRLNEVHDIRGNGGREGGDGGDEEEAEEGGEFLRGVDTGDDAVLTGAGVKVLEEAGYIAVTMSLVTGNVGNNRADDDVVCEDGNEEGHFDF